MDSIIQIDNLSKSFGSINAVKNLSFRVKKGELFAFLGLNGAGKSTTINIICGQLSKDEGSVIINGVNIDSNIDSVKRSLGVVFQNSVLDGALTVQENLSSRAALYGITGADFKNRLAELSKLLDLGDLLKRTLSKLSGGQRRRIDIARALLHRPQILILDEPTTGLDPQTRKTVWKVIESLRHDEGMTVFLTTHYMEEAADADYVVILDNGSVSAHGTPHELRNKYSMDSITLYNIDENTAKSLKLPYTAIHDAYRFSIPNTEAATKLILENPKIFKDYEITKGKMDDVFLAVTGKSLQEA